MTSSLTGFDVQHGGDLFTEVTAIFNPGGTRTHRYVLIHRWDERPPVVFCMLNPSTADALRPDNTITRCVGFARRLDAGGLIAVNLFAYRATDPDDLTRAADAVGALNDTVLDAYLLPGQVVIAAWGAHPFAAERAAAVLERLTRRGVEVSCLATTKTGHPGHPLYLPNNAPLRIYQPTGAVRSTLPAPPPPSPGEVP